MLLLRTLFKAVNSNQKLSFRVSIVTSHQKLYPDWKKLENFFPDEFEHVYSKAVAALMNNEQTTKIQSDENSSESGDSESSYKSDDLLF
jgi:hypothetical protein